MAAHLSNDALYAQLRERQEGLSTRVTGLETEMRTGFASVTSAVSQLSNELRGGQKTQWPVIWSAAAVVMGVLVTVGGLVVTPLQNNQTAITVAIKEIRDNTVPRTEMMERWKRAAEDRSEINDRLVDTRDNAVTRGEWNERTKTVDTSFAAQAARIDELRRDHQSLSGSLGNGRDTITDLRAQLNELRERILRQP